MNGGVQKGLWAGASHGARGAELKELGLPMGRDNPVDMAVPSLLKEPGTRRDMGRDQKGHEEGSEA